ncbi:MAG: YwaF family protein [Bacillota bacterium]|nr:YwaF family protein [Bacillota bacterium]
MKIELYNGVFFMMVATMTAVGILLWLLLRRLPQEKRRKGMLLLCAALIILFVVYRLLQSQDDRYLEYYGLEVYNWWEALPLHLCYVSLFLMPLGIIKRWKVLLGFCFYITPLGAMMTLVFPDPLFVGCSLFEPSAFCFYLLHCLLAISGILLAPLGFFRPNFRAIWSSLALLFILAAIMHVVNRIMQHTVCPHANYFYTCDTVGISLLELFWNLIPIPWVYEIPILSIPFVYMMIITVPFILVDRYRNKNRYGKNGGKEIEDHSDPIG